ncbi:hypothetical protein ACH35V_33075 [Actinomadura sp. 1N219]|uniref:hypothetical protein n=1 Tax=Actinomadura sp. 1N219 TaxID=3375152 RepID=UPI00379EA728
MHRLLSTPRLKFKGLGRRQYQYFDTDDNVLASVRQIEGERPRGKLGRLLANERDYSRTVLQALSPDGAPVFIIERPDEGQEQSIAPIVYTSDGSRAGRVDADPLVDGRGIDKSRILQFRWELRDVHDAVQCRAEQRASKMALRIKQEALSKKVDFTDASGSRIALFDGKWLDVNHQLPDVLQLLVVASPIAFDLLDGA